MEDNEKLFENMMRTIDRYAPYANAERIRKAFLFAEKRHQGQKRKSGEP